MAVIKDVQDMNEREMKVFKKYLANYYRRICAASSPSPNFCEALLFLQANRRAAKLIEEIRAGYKTGFVSFDFDFESMRDSITTKPSGFLIGYDTGEGTNNLELFFVEPAPSSYPRHDVIHELLKEYIAVAKTNGSFYIQTETDSSDVHLNEDLKTLSFKQVNKNHQQRIYKREIRRS